MSGVPEITSIDFFIMFISLKHLHVCIDLSHLIRISYADVMQTLFVLGGYDIDKTITFPSVVSVLHTTQKKNDICKISIKACIFAIKTHVAIIF